MDVAIRTITEEEFPAFLRANEAAFSAVPTEEDLERERWLARLDRCFAAFDGQELVGTAGVYEMPMSVPGGEVAAGYVTGVGVKPTHRRRGIATELMRRELEDAHARGELVDVLYASEGGIYGRFGYGLAALGMSIRIESSRSAFVRGYEPSGRLRLVDRDAAVKDVLAVHDAVRIGRPGMVGLDEVRLDYTLHDHGPPGDLPLFFVLHEGAGGVDGYAIYRVSHDWPGSIPDSVLTVRDLQATTPEAYADLWRYVFDVDLIGHVQAWNRAMDEPLVHLVREPRRLRGTVRDNLWVRLVDVAGALGRRRYSIEGALAIEVRDAFCPWNEGRYAIEVDGAGTAVAGRSDGEPDLVCTASDVGAAYLGGTSFGQLHRAGRVEERSPGALAKADAMFGWDPAPWCPYVF